MKIRILGEPKDRWNLMAGISAITGQPLKKVVRSYNNGQCIEDLSEEEVDDLQKVLALMDLDVVRVVESEKE